MADASLRPRYIAILCVVALVILVAGVLLRPSKIPVPVRSESEIYRLQVLAEQRNLQNTRLFFEGKARDLVAKSQAARATPDKFPFRSPGTGEYMLLVSAQESGQPVWAVTAAAGVTKTRCEGRELEEVQAAAAGLNLPPAPPFPPLVNYTTDLVYRGLDPRVLNYVPLPPATPNLVVDRVEAVNFKEPGRYLVVCGVRPHFDTSMHGYVNVKA